MRVQLIAGSGSGVARWVGLVCVLALAGSACSGTTGQWERAGRGSGSSTPDVVESPRTNLEKGTSLGRRTATAANEAEPAGSSTPSTSDQGKPKDKIRGEVGASTSDDATQVAGPTAVSGADAIAVTTKAWEEWPFDISKGVPTYYSQDFIWSVVGLSGPAALDELSRYSSFMETMGTDWENVVCESTGEVDEASGGTLVHCAARASDEVTRAFQAPPVMVQGTYAVNTEGVVRISEFVEASANFAPYLQEAMTGNPEIEAACVADSLSVPCAQATTALAQAIGPNWPGNS